MKKYLDKLKRNIKINKTLFVFLTVLVIVGLASGALFASILSETDKKIVSDYLNNFIINIKNNNVSQNLIDTLTCNLGISIIIWIVGISIIGIILIIPLIYIKSFILGFTIAEIIINFKINGILLSLTYIIPNQIINILVYIIISSYSIMISYKMIKSMKNKNNFNFKNIMNRYTYILIFSLIILFITSLYEVYVLPNILKLAIKFIK